MLTKSIDLLPITFMQFLVKHEEFCLAQIRQLDCFNSKVDYIHCVVYTKRPELGVIVLQDIRVVECVSEGVETQSDGEQVYAIPYDRLSATDRHAEYVDKRIQCRDKSEGCESVNDYIKKEILEPPALPSPGTYPPGYHSEVSLNLRASRLHATSKIRFTTELKNPTAVANPYSPSWIPLRYT